jgi:hypothetical protein
VAFAPRLTGDVTDMTCNDWVAVELVLVIAVDDVVEVVPVVEAIVDDIAVVVETIVEVTTGDCNPIPVRIFSD